MVSAVVQIYKHVKTPILITKHCHMSNIDLRQDLYLNILHEYLTT